MRDFERDVHFSPVDEPLRRDVSFLGRLLGEILVEQGREGLFDAVEQAREKAIRRRDLGSDTAALAALVRDFDAPQAAEVVRAFSAYFSLVNMAEQVHRIRRRRAYLVEAADAQRGSLLAVCRTLADAGFDRDRVIEMLRNLQVTPVFTAHPTEAVRRTMLAKELRISSELVRRIEQPVVTSGEQAAVEARLKNEIGLAWQTADQASVRPSVADEVEHVAFHLTEVFFRIVPGFYNELSRVVDEVFGGGDEAPGVPCPILRFGSWVGGDMDGNPNVGPETILATLERHRQLILDRYRGEVHQLFDHLSQSPSRASISEEIEARCAHYRERLPDAAAEISPRHEAMPYRVLLSFIRARLGATATEAAWAYGGPEELLADLELMAASLRRDGPRAAGLKLVERLVQRVRTFGFHLATLDVRQDALVHRDQVGTLLGRDDFPELAPPERTRLLRAALDRDEAPPSGAADSEVVSTVRVCRTIAEARVRFGSRAIGPYIISMAQGPDDVLALLLLARRAGLAAEDGAVRLDVAPLFETVDDLHHAHETLGAMLADPMYRAHLRARGDEQLVMLGYSDSSKISGIAASRWALFRAQERLTEAAEGAGVRLTLFHGRGGTVGRGGSKPRAAILSDPCGAVSGHLRITEQGEMINLKFGLRDIAERTLELMTGAVLEAGALCDHSAVPKPTWIEAMETVAAAGRKAYEGLVHDNPDLVRYFRLATPIDVIERMPIGSRPASRRSGHGVEDLRAIPWVFAWMQSRHVLPGWLGVGAGLAAAAESHGEAVLREMAERWPFFGNLLADVEMVLAKADLGIAACYADLAGEVGQSMYPLILRHFENARTWVCRIRGVETVLDREPNLQRSIRLRNPYVDPMSLVQVDLLRRWRAGDRLDGDLERALFTTVRGIARGLRNTG